MKEIATDIGRAAVRDKHGEGGIAGWEVKKTLHCMNIYAAANAVDYLVCVMDGLEFVLAYMTLFWFVTTGYMSGK